MRLAPWIIVPAVATLVAGSLLTAAAVADNSAPPADDVLVTTARTLSVANEPGFTLRFRRDGTATYDGVLNGRDGHYEAQTDFAAVQTAVSDAKLCERDGIPLYVEGLPKRASTASTEHSIVELRCAGDVKTFSDQYASDLPGVATSLVKLGTGLAWTYDGPARRESIVRFAR